MQVAGCLIHFRATLSLSVCLYAVQVHVRVNIPTKPGKEEVKLVEELRDVVKSNAKRPGFAGFKF